MDKATIVGVVIAIGAIVLGLTLEGGKIGQIMQPTAALIVLGGTLGATLVQFPLEVVLAAFRSLITIFLVPKNDPLGVIHELVTIAHKARKQGIVSLDRDLENIEDPFLKKSLMLAVDGTEPGELRKIMELELQNQGEHEDNIPRVFESAGGFSPTIGIIGAILGLIQVRLLITQYKLPPERLSAAGYGEFHPVSTDDTAAGRSQNRRLDIVILTPYEFMGEGGSRKDGLVFPPLRASPQPTQ